MEHKTWIRSKVLSSRLFQIRSSSTALFIGLGIFFAQAVLWAQVPIDAATDSSGRVTQTVGRESISVTGRVIVNGVMHEDPVISRVGMQIFVDGVLAKKIMTHAEEMARKKRAEDRNFAQYVIDSSSEAAAHVACSGGSVEEIQEAWLKTFREKIEKGPGQRRPATLEVVNVDGLKISVRISREGEKPYVNECILLSPEECEHAPPLKSDEERAHERFLWLVKDIESNDLVVITHNFVSTSTGEVAMEEYRYIQEVKRKLRDGKKVTTEDYMFKLPEGLVDDLKRLHEKGALK